MKEATFFGVAICIVSYAIGIEVKKKLKLAIFNPLIIASLIIFAFLFIFRVDYESFNSGAKYLSYFLTPATVCLAVPLYDQMTLLKNNLKAILIGIASGVIASLGSILTLSVLFGLTHEQYITLLPKSLTTAIGMGISEELGGIVTITVVSIIVTGILGNMMAEFILKMCHVTEPIAKGIAIGTSAHAVGTAKAMEMGEIEGAMSGLSIVVAGLMTVIAASFFANFL